MFLDWGRDRAVWGVSCVPAVEAGPWGHATANRRPCSTERLASRLGRGRLARAWLRDYIPPPLTILQSSGYLAS